MVFHANPVIRKTNLAAWRAWRTFTFGLHSSAVGLSSGPGATDRSEELSAVSSEKPPHAPVMVKEVLHYLDIQPAQVCLHRSYLYEPLGSLMALMSVLRGDYCLT